LAELLENLDASFDTMRIPEMKGNWLGKREVRAIHKMGIYVAQDWGIEDVENPKLPAGMTLPVIASCFMIHPKHETDDRLNPRFAFAIRQPGLPPSVEQVKGTPYQFGECYELSGPKRGEEKPRTFWMWAWVVVRPDGLIVFPREKQRVVHQLNHRRLSHDSTSRRSSFTSTSWRAPALIDRRGDREEHTQQEVEHLLSCMFRQLLLWWAGRESQWSVGVRKSGKRVTFSVRPEHTAAYFSDRNKVATQEGKSKKIIHFVREHTRSNGSVVRAHVRGLREFEWRGYQCAVTAPSLTGAVLTAGFDLQPVEAPEETPGMLTLEQAAQWVAEAEDQDARKRA
jgi:hypothetical protein